MQLESSKYVKDDKKELKALYKEAFPAVERVPFFFLMNRIRKNGIGWNIYHKEEQFVGLSYTVRESDFLFVFFLAVKKGQRGQGIGTAILSDLKEKNPECSIVLETESLQIECSNMKERKRRVLFYKKNGFSMSDFIVRENKEIYQTMIKGEGLTKEIYERIFKKLLGPFGFLFCRTEIKGTESGTDN